MKLLYLILLFILSLNLINGSENGFFTCDDGRLRGISSITFNGGRINGLIVGLSCYEFKDKKMIFNYPIYTYCSIPRSQMDGKSFEGNAVILDPNNILNTYQFDSATIKFDENYGINITLINPHIVVHTFNEDQDN